MYCYENACKIRMYALFISLLLTNSYSSFTQLNWRSRETEVCNLHPAMIDQAVYQDCFELCLQKYAWLDRNTRNVFVVDTGKCARKAQHNANHRRPMDTPWSVSCALLRWTETKVSTDRGSDVQILIRQQKGMSSSAQGWVTHSLKLDLTQILRVRWMVTFWKKKKCILKRNL